MSVDHILHRATAAATLLKEQLQAVTDDQETIADTIEGETDLPRIISWAMMENGKDEAQAEGVAAYIKQLQQLRERLEHRVERRKAAILAAMVAGEITTLPTPAGTVSRRKVPPKVVVVDEALLPEQFWRPGKPTVNKTAIEEALAAGKKVLGAMLSNGSETLAVRA